MKLKGWFADYFINFRVNLPNLWVERILLLHLLVPKIQDLNPNNVFSPLVIKVSTLQSVLAYTSISLSCNIICETEHDSPHFWKGLNFLEKVFLIFVMKRDEILGGRTLAELLFLRSHFHWIRFLDFWECMMCTGQKDKHIYNRGVSLTNLLRTQEIS